MQRKTDPATEVHAVKSKEIETAEGQEANDWPGVVAQQERRGHAHRPSRLAYDSEGNVSTDQTDDLVEHRWTRNNYLYDAARSGCGAGRARR